MINKTILELEHIYTSHTHAETIELLDKLVSFRDELIEIETSLIEEGGYGDEVVSKTLSEIEEQLICLRRNIYTIEDVILLHENQTFQKRNFDNERYVICLN
jgi:hypothetical protein